MTLPATVTTELASLEAQVKAASPLDQASWQTVRAMQLNADQLLSDVEAAQYSLIGQLDTWVASTQPEPIIVGVVQVYNSAVDEASITQLRGIIGRVASNLNQLGVAPVQFKPR